MQIWSAEIKELEKLYESLRGQLQELGRNWDSLSERKTLMLYCYMQEDAWKLLLKTFVRVN
jgi:hypothetical protein